MEGRKARILSLTAQIVSAHVSNNALQADAYVASRVRDTLEDIRQFVHAA